MKTTKEMIEVMQAFERGERIEAKSLNIMCLLIRRRSFYVSKKKGTQI